MKAVMIRQAKFNCEAQDAAEIDVADSLPTPREFFQTIFFDPSIAPTDEEVAMATLARQLAMDIRTGASAEGLCWDKPNKVLINIYEYAGRELPFASKCDVKNCTEAYLRKDRWVFSGWFCNDNDKVWPASVTEVTYAAHEQEN
jgi:hypothetical protein